MRSVSFGALLPAAALVAVAAGAVEPEGGALVAERNDPGAGHHLVTDRHDGVSLPGRRLDGPVQMRAFHVTVPAGGTRMLMAGLRARAVEAGFTPVFECETRSCGGFDFRFAIETLPEPAMHVDLGDFLFLSAERGAGATAEGLSILVSRSTMRGHVQVVRAGPGLDLSESFASSRDEDPLTGAAEAAEEPPGDGSVAGFLTQRGSLVLDGVVFATGAAEVVSDDNGLLAELAAFLVADPERRVVLVGHTDSVGSLDGNIVLSRRRAEAVLRHLVEAHGVPAGQMRAEGVGYLAPRAPNTTEEGRARNRRVEVVATATE